jgi:hypothetical protein
MALPVIGAGKSSYPATLEMIGGTRNITTLVGHYIVVFERKTGSSGIVGISALSMALILR